MYRSLIAAGVFAALALPAAAGATSVNGTIGATTLQGGTAAANVSFAYNPITFRQLVTDAAQTLTASGTCTTVDAHSATCPSGELVANFRNNDDRFDGGFSFYSVSVHGGGGADRLFGNGSSTQIWGDGGNDHIEVGSNGRSTAHGGSGDDELLAGLAGQEGWMDGGDGADLQVGTAPYDDNDGNGGNDQLFTLRGAGGDLDGGSGADVIVNLSIPVNPHVLFGTTRYKGADGNDTIVGGLGEDIVDAGLNNDTVVVSGDSAVDDVTCGPGRDTVYADPGDEVDGDCEVVYDDGTVPTLPQVEAAKAHLYAAFPNLPGAPAPAPPVNN